MDRAHDRARSRGQTDPATNVCLPGDALSPRHTGEADYHNGVQRQVRGHSLSRFPMFGCRAGDL